MLTINGTTVEIAEDWEEASLLEYLRDRLGLIGTKFGCGIGVCGACTVHLNGQAIRSCQTKVSSIQGQSVTTIEGLGEQARPHPVQVAWLRANVAQCGYCQPGQIMTAVAYLNSINREPTLEEARTAMNGNLCRCGTYNRIAEAVVDASRLTKAAS